MKNKFIYLFLMILCFGLAISAVNVLAQTGGDKVLVAEKKPLKQSEVNSLIEFYEWAFETKFNDSQRDKFQWFTERDYRAKPETVRGEINTISETFVKIKASDEDVQRKTREVFVESYITDLRKNETDDDAQFMIGIYENRNDVQNTDISENAPDRSAALPAGRGASNLVGKWLKSGGSGGSRDYTGKTLYNSGNDVIFEFYADGGMMFINDKNTLSITQCKITEMTKIPGTYSLSGNTLTMNLGAGTSVGTNSCDSKGNFKKNLSGGETMTKKVVVKKMESIFRPDAPLILCLDGQKDDECYEKVIK